MSYPSSSHAPQLSLRHTFATTVGNIQTIVTPAEWTAHSEILEMLPIDLEYEPMEALLTDKSPTGEGWQYEPKWDGFRCLVFRDGEAVSLRSKSGRVLERYFPEIESYVRALKPQKFIRDGEIVVPTDKGFSFDLLLQRIHPAESRIKKFSERDTWCTNSVRYSRGMQMGNLC